jgi:hypothetical protein
VVARVPVNLYDLALDLGHDDGRIAGLQRGHVVGSVAYGQRLRLLDSHRDGGRTLRGSRFGIFAATSHQKGRGQPKHTAQARGAAVLGTIQHKDVLPPSYPITRAAIGTSVRFPLLREAGRVC